jgi:hypothetical protein
MFRWSFRSVLWLLFSLSKRATWDLAPLDEALSFSSLYFNKIVRHWDSSTAWRPNSTYFSLIWVKNVFLVEWSASLFIKEAMFFLIMSRTMSESSSFILAAISLFFLLKFHRKDVFLFVSTRWLTTARTAVVVFVYLFIFIAQNNVNNTNNNNNDIISNSKQKQ